MKIAELKERVAKWEDLHTDFKERFGSNRELAKDLVCFANTDGDTEHDILSDDVDYGIGSRIRRLEPASHRPAGPATEKPKRVCKVCAGLIGT